MLLMPLQGWQAVACDFPRHSGDNNLKLMLRSSGCTARSGILIIPMPASLRCWSTLLLKDLCGAAGEAVLARCAGRSSAVACLLLLLLGDAASTGNDHVGPQITIFSDAGDRLPRGLPHCWMLALANCMGLAAAGGLRRARAALMLTSAAGRCRAPGGAPTSALLRMLGARPLAGLASGDRMSSETSGCAEGCSASASATCSGRSGHLHMPIT